MCIKNSVKLSLLIFVIFLLLFNIAYFTPMHSDDFPYYLKGLSIQAHLDHYMNWSGRIIVDYISSGILNFKNHTLVAFISALVLPLTIYNIATIPSFRKEDRQNINQNNLWIIVCILFLSYWLSNPSLGQTTFWIVGEANYLWPLLFISFYIKYGLRFTFQETPIKLWQYTICGVLAFISGLSNELVSVVTVSLTTLFLCFLFWKKHPNTKLILLCFLLITLGSAILILAPGNMVRAAHPAFAEWRELPTSSRIQRHLTMVIPNALISYGIFYLIFAWFLLDVRKQLSKHNKITIVIFLCTTLLFLIALIASPTAGSPRANLTGLFFLLIALSCVLQTYLNNQFSLKNRLFLTSLILLFILSYALINQSYRSIFKQNQVRNNIVALQNANGTKVISIPAFFSTPLLREGDAADWGYHVVEMSTYLHSNKIVIFPIDFDYSTVLDKSCPKIYSNEIFKQSYLKCIYTKRNPLERNVTFFFEFSPEIKPYLDNQHRFLLNIYKVTEGEDLPEPYKIDIPLKPVNINERYFTSAKIRMDDLKLNKKARVTLKIYKDDITEKPIDVSL